VAEPSERFPIVREAVASFPDVAHFREAVSRVLAAGFRTSDISVLASHDSLDAAGALDGDAEAENEAVSASLTDEVKWVGPLVVAGIVMLSGGPIAAGIAALVGAGLGGAAVKEVLDRYTAARHTDEFEAALKAGAVLLWVRVDDPLVEPTVVRILEEAGGRHAHIHARKVTPEPG
jgi:hypothetical protein